MTSNNRKLELYMDTPGYPWQVVEGEGITWLILRKTLVFSGDIADLVSVGIKEFDWEQVFKNDEKGLLAGRIGLQIFYKEKKAGEQNVVFEAVADEENLYQEIISQGVTINGILSHRDTVNSQTSFPSFLLDPGDLIDTDGHKGSYSQKDLSLNWQAWLLGSGGAKEPKIEKVHLAQIGLKTALVEILLKLEGSAEIEVDEKELSLLQNQWVINLPREEITCNLEDDGIYEALGLAVQRAFYNCYSLGQREKLCLETTVKLSLIYISSNLGGERLLVASQTREEKNWGEVRYHQLEHPVGHRFYKESFNLAQLDDKRVLCQSDYKWIIDYSKPQKTESLDRNKPRESIIGPAVLVARKRPGEKYFKKAQNKKGGFKGTEAVYIIKI